MAKVLILGSFSKSLINFRGHLIRRLLADGHQVIAAAPEEDQDVTRQLEDWGASFHLVPMDRQGVNPARDLHTLYRLHRLFGRVEPAVFLGYSIKPVVYGLLAAWLADVPSRYALITGVGTAFTQTQSARQYLLQSLASMLYGLSLRTSQKVIFQNSDDAYLFCARRLVGGPEQVALINGSGVDIEEFQPVPLPTKPHFLLIARLLKTKGIGEYVAAAEQVRRHHPQARFKLVGWPDTGPDAPTSSELERCIHSPSIEYRGYLDDVRPAIAESAVYVLPSYREGTPRTVLEAMAMGRPIITTDVPGCRQTVRSGVNGFVVPPRDVGALARAMTHFIGEPEVVREMGLRSRQIAAERYDVHAVNDTLLAALDLGARTMPPPIPDDARLTGSP